MNSDPDIFPEEDPLIILDINSDFCMANNGKYTKHTRNIARRLHIVRNSENWKMHKKYCCEGGMQLADIAADNVGDNDLNPRMKYIMVRLDNWDSVLVQAGG